MASLVTKLILATVMLLSGQVLAQAPADENFDDDSLFDITSNNFDNDGVNYKIIGTTTYRAATYNSAFNLSEGGGTDYALLFDKNAEGGISTITISATDGSFFELAGMSMDFLSDTDVQFTSSAGGNFSLSPNDGLYVLHQNYDFTLQPGFDNITSFTISGTNMVGDIDDLNFESITDSNGNLTAAAGVTEPVALPATATSTAGAVDVFDFTISDGGGDTFTLDVSSIDVNVSGISSDAERGQVTWRLNGPDAANVQGIYDPGTDKITFSGLSISIPESGNETYTINAYFNDNTNLTEDHTFVLTIDGDTDLTLVNDGSKSQMGTTSAVTNSTGSPIDITATKLAFTTQPGNSTSGSALGTQPAVSAQDAAGNTDVDFTETITLDEASAGTLTNNTQTATNGVATFTGLTYSATADQESFTLTANDQDGVGSNLPTVDANSVTSDVVATKLVYTTQPAPTSFKADGTSTSFTTVPVVAAVDANDMVDTGYSTGISLAEVNGTGSATLTGTGDTDGSASTVTITPASGVSTFNGLEINYSLNDVNTDEQFNLQATSGGLTSANSTQLTAEGNAAPTVTGLPSDVTVLEETESDVDLSGTTFADADGDGLTVTLEASTDSFDTLADGSGVGAGVTETLVNSTTITLAGAAADINTYLSTASNITYTGATNVSGEDAANITVHANDGQTNPNLGTINLDITDINDAPTLTATGQNPTFIEGDAAPGADLYSGVTASTIEAVQRFKGMNLTVTNLSDGASELLRFDGSDVALTDGYSVTTATNGLTAEVSVTGSTATVGFSGASLTEAEMQTLVDGLAYRNTSDNPTAGSNRAVTITSISDNGGTTNGGADVSVLSLQSTVSLTAVNSAPVLGNLDGDNSGLQAGGSSVRIDNGGDATVSNPDSDDYNSGYLRVVDNGGNNTANGNFSLDGTNVTANGDAVLSAEETISVGGTAIGTVHATNDGQGGNSLEINFTNADATNARIQTLVQHIRWGAAAGSGAQTFTLTLSDGDGTDNGGDEDAAADFTMTLGNPPEIANLDGDAVDFLVDGSPVTLDALAGATLSDADAPANLNGGSLTATVSSGAATSEDILQLNAAGAVSLSGSTAGSNVSVSGTIVGTLHNSIVAGNDLRINFNTNATLARVEVLLQNLQYANNTSPVTEASRQVSVSVTDNDGLPSDPATITVSTVANQPPTLSATASDPTFTEGNLATGLFSAATASTIESGQQLTGLSVTVSNVASGSEEYISVGGTNIALNGGNTVTTAINNLNATVSLTSGMATVSVTGGSLSASDLQGLLNSLSYRNNSDDPGTTDRVVTITGLSDNGGTANGGDDTAELTLASTVSITTVNDAPTLTVTGTDPTYTDGDESVEVFTGSTASTVEAGQDFTGLTLTVGNLVDGADEKLTIDGTEVDLTNGTTATTEFNSFSLNVAMAGTTATVTLTGAEIAPATLNTIIDGIAYRNASFTPSTGTTRVITLTGLTDDGGTANGGVAAGAFGITSSVSVADLVRPAPGLASSSPADGATDVVLDEPVSLTLDKDVTAVNLPGVTITDGGGNPVSGVSASLTSVTEVSISHNPFDIVKTYTVTIPAGAVQNMDGVSNAQISWSFETISNPPNLVASSLEDNAKAVAIDQVFSFTFSEDIISKNPESISLTDTAGNAVDGILPEISGQELLIDHDELKENMGYKLHIPKDAVTSTNGIGNELIEREFTTIKGSLNIISTFPANGSQGGAVDSAVVITFEYPLSIQNEDGFIIRSIPENAQVPGVSISAEGRKLIVEHPELERNQRYSVIIYSGTVVNSDGIYNKLYELTFHTEMDKPLITSVSPAPQESLVAPDSYVEAIFSQPLSIADTSLISLSYADGAIVGGMEAVMNGNQLHINHEAFEASRQVTVELGQGALINADNTALADTSWTFFTAPELPAIPRLDTPHLNAAMVDTALILAWHPAKNSEYYYTEIALDTTFNQPVYTDEGTGTTLTLSALEYSTTYYWHVRAVNAAGNSGWSQTFRFHTKPEESILVAAPLDSLFLKEDFAPLEVADLDSVFTNLYGGTLSYSVSTDPTMATTGVEGSMLEISSVENAFGDFLVAVTAEDSLGNRVSDSLLVSVEPVNDAPVIAITSDTTFTTEEGVFTVAYGEWIIDPESPLEDLTIHVSADAEEVEVSVDTQTGTAQVISQGFVGITNLQVIVTDPNGATAEAALKVEFLQSVSNDTKGNIPHSYTLSQNYPNPFNPSTTISYALPKAGEVRLEVFNLLGRRVALVVDKTQSAGRYQVNFEAGGLSSGVYIYRLQAGEHVFIKKLTLVK